MLRLPFSPRLPQPSFSAQYLELLNIRLYELFKAIHGTISQIFDGYLYEVTTVTGDYTATVSDQIIFVNNTANCTITIPKAGDTLKKSIVVKKISNNADTVTISPVSGNIEGAATKVISTYLVSHEAASDGTNYWLI